jgi:predicted DsbA family dithiol-disulfide isomerase
VTQPSSQPPSEPLLVQIWSDVACPWCYIGKRRFERGLSVLAGQAGSPQVQVEYRSFELSPDTPVDFDGTEVDFLAKHKGIAEPEVRRMLDQVTGIAAEEGLAYDFVALRHTNTVKAHQVLQLAKARGVQPAVKERLLSAYFVEGRHLGRDDELAALAAESGLDRAEVLGVLAEGTYLDAVRADQALAREYGINGVPFYVLGGRYGISGAQPAEVFSAALEKAASS